MPTWSAFLLRFGLRVGNQEFVACHIKAKILSVSFPQRRRELAKKENSDDSEPEDYVPYVPVKDRKKSKVSNATASKDLFHLSKGDREPPAIQ